MLNVTQCRKIIGRTAEKMTDSEIEQLRDLFIVLSDLAIDSYLEKRKSISNGNNYENFTRRKI